MKFSVVVHAAPYSSEASLTALKFCRTLLSNGHQIYRLFYFRDGVQNLNALTVGGQDESDLPAQWQDFLRQHDIDATVCVTSALKRGLLDSQESMRYEKGSVSLSDAGQIAGLGQLVDACLESDRLVNFG